MESQTGREILSPSLTNTSTMTLNPHLLQLSLSVCERAEVCGYCSLGWMCVTVGSWSGAYCTFCHTIPWIGQGFLKMQMLPPCEEFWPAGNKYCIYQCQSLENHTLAMYFSLKITNPYMNSMGCLYARQTNTEVCKQHIRSINRFLGVGSVLSG